MIQNELCNAQEPEFKKHYNPKDDGHGIIRCDCGAMFIYNEVDLPKDNPRFIGKEIY